MDRDDAWQYVQYAWRYPISEFSGRARELRRAQRLRPASEMLERLELAGSYARFVAANPGRANCRLIDAKFHDGESVSFAEFRKRVSA